MIKSHHLLALLWVAAAWWTPVAAQGVIANLSPNNWDCSVTEDIKTGGFGINVFNAPDPAQMKEFPKVLKTKSQLVLMKPGCSYSVRFNSAGGVEPNKDEILRLTATTGDRYIIFSIECKKDADGLSYKTWFTP